MNIKTTAGVEITPYIKNINVHTSGERGSSFEEGFGCDFDIDESSIKTTSNKTETVISFTGYAAAAEYYGESVDYTYEITMKADSNELNKAAQEFLNDTVKGAGTVKDTFDFEVISCEMKLEGGIENNLKEILPQYELINTDFNVDYFIRDLLRYNNSIRQIVEKYGKVKGIDINLQDDIANEYLEEKRIIDNDNSMFSEDFIAFDASNGDKVYKIIRERVEEILSDINNLIKTHLHCGVEFST